MYVTTPDLLTLRIIMLTAVDAFAAASPLPTASPAKVDSSGVIDLFGGGYCSFSPLQNFTYHFHFHFMVYLLATGEFLTILCMWCCSWMYVHFNYSLDFSFSLSSVLIFVKILPVELLPCSNEVNNYYIFALECLAVILQEGMFILLCQIPE